MAEFISVNPRSFGLEISDSSLKIAKVRKKLGFFRLVSFNETNLDEGIIKKGNIEKEEELIKAIKKLVSEANGEKIKTRNVSLSIPEEKVFVKIIKMPDIEGRELEKAVYFEAENHIPLEIEKMYLDFEVLEKNELGKKILIIAVSKEIIDSYISVLIRSDLKPMVFESESLSSYRALAENKESFFLIDIKKEKINFSFFKKGFVRFSVSSYKETLSKSIVDKAKEYLDYYPSKNEIEKMLVSGSKDDLREVKKYFLESFGEKVYFKNSSFNLLIPEKKEFSNISNKLSNYASVLGIALRGAGNNQ